MTPDNTPVFALLYKTPEEHPIVTIERDVHGLSTFGTRFAIRVSDLNSLINEVSMSLEKCGLTTRSLAELSLIISRSARVGNQEGGSLTTSLATLWKSSRSLERRWSDDLEKKSRDFEWLSEMTPRIFMTGMLVRIWSTALAGGKRGPDQEAWIRVARRSIDSLMRVRNGVLNRLLDAPYSQSVRVSELDRLRRRCERWTDMLIGSMADRSHCYEFGFDAARVFDFSEECSLADATTGPNVAEHLMTAGLRFNFIRHLSDTKVEETEIARLVESIMSSIPSSLFHRDGTFKTLIENQIIVSRQCADRQTTLEIARFKSSGHVSNP